MIKKMVDGKTTIFIIDIRIKIVKFSVLDDIMVNRVSTHIKISMRLNF